jgi:hypothetical protein
LESETFGGKNFEENFREKWDIFFRKVNIQVFGFREVFLKKPYFDLDICGSFESQILSKPGNANWGGRLSTVDLLIKVACFVKEVNNIFDIKRADLN